MTAIAYRAGWMAADTLESYEGLRLGTTKKIVRNAHGDLGAAAGGSVYCHVFHEWFMANGGVDGPGPAIKADGGGFGALFVSARTKQVFRVSSEGIIYPAGTAPFYFEGACTGLLAGAMAMGASAEQAVQIAIEYDRYCGGTVQVERLGRIDEAIDDPTLQEIGELSRRDYPGGPLVIARHERISNGGMLFPMPIRLSHTGTKS